MAAVRDDHRRVLEHLAELLGQVVERLHHQLVELARRVLGRRQRGERLAAVDEPPELGLGHLLADQRDGHPGGDEHDRDGAGQQRQQVAQPAERRRVEQEQQDAGEEGGAGGGSQRWAECVPHLGSRLERPPAPGPGGALRTALSYLTTPITWPSGSVKRPIVMPTSPISSGPMIRDPPSSRPWPARPRRRAPRRRR